MTIVIRLEQGKGLRDTNGLTEGCNHKETGNCSREWRPCQAKLKLWPKAVIYAYYQNVTGYICPRTKRQNTY